LVAALPEASSSLRCLFCPHCAGESSVICSGCFSFDVPAVWKHGWLLGMKPELLKLYHVNSAAIILFWVACEIV
jgi:hypothetical protein